MKRLIPILVTALLAAPSLAAAQTNASQTSVKAIFDMLKGNLSKSAEKVPEDVYSFKPTPEVRSFGQLVGHVADSQFSMCAAAAGEKPTQSGIEKSATTKAALTKALNDSIAYCDKVIAGMDDTKGVEVMKFFTGPTHAARACCRSTPPTATSTTGTWSPTCASRASFRRRPGGTETGRTRVQEFKSSRVQSDPASRQFLRRCAPARRSILNS